MPDPKTIKLTDLFQPTPKQQEFLSTIALHPYCLFGGAAGGGKSYCLRWFAIITLVKSFAIHGVRNAQFGLFCEDFPALKQRHLSVWDIPSWLGEVSNSQTDGLCFKLRDEYGGGRILLGNLDDPGKYDSTEFIGVAVDESTKNPWAFFDQLRKRLRWAAIAGQPHLPCGGHCSDKFGVLVECPIDSHHSLPAWNFPFALGANPGGESHAQHKRVFIDKEYSGDLSNLAPIAAKFAFVQAKSSDNPFLPADYKREHLDTLPEKLRLAYADGYWDAFEGQYFPNFDANLRQVPAQTIDKLIQSWWPRWISMDWGYAHHTATHWHTKGVITPEQAKTYLNRDWATAREVIFTYRERVLNNTGERELGQIIVSSSGSESISRVFLSPDAFSKRSSVNTIAQEIADVLKSANIPYPTPADNERVNGWRLMAELITHDEWFISSDCPAALTALPLLCHDKAKPEDVEKTDDVSDDVADGLRYGLYSMLSTRKPPIEVIRAEVLSEAVSYTHMHLLDLQFASKHRSARRSFNLHRTRHR